MTRNARTRPKWLPGTIIAVLSMLLFAPSAAWAGSRDYDHHRDRNSGQHWSDSGHARHLHASHRRHHHAHRKHKQRGKRRGHHKHHADYYCGICDRYFHARGGLYDHVANRHRIPARYLELAIRFDDFGWFFFGG